MIYKPLAHILIYLLFYIFLVYDNICLGLFLYMIHLMLNDLTKLYRRSKKKKKIDLDELIFIFLGLVCLKT